MPSYWHPATSCKQIERFNVQIIGWFVQDQQIAFPRHESWPAKAAPSLHLTETAPVPVPAPRQTGTPLDSR